MPYTTLRGIGSAWGFEPVRIATASGRIRCDSSGEVVRNPPV